MAENFAARSPVTVGREAELATIDRLLGQARSGHGGCLVLVGEAGSGKTRLLREAAARAARVGTVVLFSDVPATVTPPPFGTVAQAVRGWVRHADLEEARLERFAPGLRLVLPEWPPSEDEPDLTTEQLRLLALEGVLRLVLHAGRRTGALVVLDDLHAADPETLEFVHHTSASITREPVALLVALRQGEGAPAEAEARALEQRGRASLMPVPPFDVRGVRAMVEAMVGEPAPAELVDELMARTDGMPLLVEELLAAHVARGALRREDGALTWSLPARGVVPRTILEMVGHKLRALPPDARRVVEAAAVLGRAEAGLLGPTTGLASDRVAVALERGGEAGLLETGRGHVAFRHGLLLDAVREGMLPGQRQDMHRRAEQAIRAAHGDDPAWLEERACHHEALGEVDGAAQLLLRAGRHHLEAQAPASAEATLRRGLALAPSAGVAAGLRDALAETLGASGRWEQALRLDEEEVERGHADAGRLARMARSALQTGRLDRADDLVARAVAAGADPGRLQALSALVSLWRGELEQAVDTASDLLESDDPRLVCEALDVVGRGNDMLGRREEAVAAFRRWIDVAGAAGLTASRLQALMELGNVEFMSTYVPDRLRQARALARQAGAYTTLVLADLSLLWCLGATGEVAQAVEMGEEAVDLARRFELDLAPHALEGLGWARGRRVHGSGHALIDEAVALAPDDPDVVVQAHDARGDVALRAGRFEEAVAHFDQALAAIRSNPSLVPMATPSMRVCALAALGRQAEAETALEEARRLAARPRLLIVPLWVEAAAALVARSEAALQDAVPPGVTVRFERATILVLAARIIGGPGAGRWLREALAVYEAGGAVDDAARVRLLIRQRGEPVPRARRASAALAEPLRRRGVTRREGEVLELIGAGLSNGEIAERLYVSVRTVESHVSSLLTKLDAGNRAALIAAALSLDGR